MTVSVDDGVTAVLEDEQNGFRLADGPYRYGVTVREDDRSIAYDRVRDPAVERIDETTLEVRGELAGLGMTHRVSVDGRGTTSRSHSSMRPPNPFRWQASRAG